MAGFSFDGSYVVGGSDEGKRRSHPALLCHKADRNPGSGLEICHTETGELVHSYKTAGPCPVVSWAPTRYCLAYSDLGAYSDQGLRIVGVDSDRK